MERSAVKQDLSVNEIEPAGFQHGDALRTLKIHPTEIYPRFWVQSSWVTRRPGERRVMVVAALVLE
jgi:hypothetical protein